MLNFGKLIRFAKISVITIILCLLVIIFLWLIQLSHSAPKMTKIKLFKPWEMNSENLDKHFKVEEKLEGSCWTASSVDPRPDAWRCMVGNRIMDPCFSPTMSTDTSTVACSGDPQSKKITLIHLNKVLPLAEANSDDFLGKSPWVLKLKHDKTCYPIGGATMGFASLRNNYSCPDESSLFGPIDCKSGVCKVFYYKPGHSKLVQKTVKSMWY